jgi:hypothetical protein
VILRFGVLVLLKSIFLLAVSVRRAAHAQALL